MADDLVLHIDGSAVAWMTRSPGGPVGRQLARTGARVEYLARQFAPGKGPMKRGIKARVTSYLGQPAVEVVSSHPATLFVLGGTRPHMIYPNGKKALKFVSGGATVFAKSVRHPGTHENNFLVKALEAAKF